ncbi:hypothetical protein ACIRP3_24425 [Streptomyces sp. NPDC101209]|uniref:hypothetical protein n=1 Tax=Streptomyces sp. NPDC101209 TaxID=3366129 RepID=UPI00382A5AB5
MRTRVVDVRGRLHEYGPGLEHAPADLVHGGRRTPLRGRAPVCWCAPAFCHADVPADAQAP